MSRRAVTKNDREVINAPAFWRMQQWAPVHPGVATTGAFTPADATMRWIGVPPVTDTTIPPRPDAVKLFRGDDFYLALDTIANSNFGAFMPGNIEHIIPLNPGVATLAYSATVNTGALRGSWLYGV